MVFSRDGRLFIAVSNTNTAAVYRWEGAWRRKETLNVALTPRQPVGMTPSAVSLSPDEKTLYVTCSDGNAVAVVDVAGEESRVLGFIPTAWYPTATLALSDGRLAIVNGRGLRSFPNARKREPGKPPAFDYVGRIQTGTISFVDRPGRSELKAFSDTVRSNSPWKEKLPSPGKIPPIEHVVYIIKENRTYDQVLGDLGTGNGDPSLVMFGEEITPNQHKLAREFVLFDHFYVNADVSADGHNWSVAGIAPDFVQKVWPNGYGGRRSTHLYRWGQEPAAMPPNGYIWNRVHEKGLSLRSYGYLGVNKPLPVADGIHVAQVLDPVLQRHADLRYRDYDLGYADMERATEFLRDFAEFERRGTWVRFTLIRLGNNHTEGTTPGRKTPRAHVADNDAALGRIIEGISRSKFWARTAIFVLEDDAQNGPDHVDSHRSPAFVISPYTRRGIADSAMYNTTSMLRTMELILGVAPMTVFDASSRPMLAAFAARPDLRPFVAEKPRVDLEERNAANNPTAARSLRMDFTAADEIDDDELNGILWLAIKGTTPPAPVRSTFGQ
jgi:DNA-binding beta-propeller fold protein YncE